MPQRFLLSLLIVFQVACGQTVQQPNKSKPFAFLDSLLKKDNYTAEFLDFEYPKEIQEITMRFQKSVAERKEWFQEYYSKNYKEGEGMPYNENFGITKEEYQKIKDLEKTGARLIACGQAMAFFDVKKTDLLPDVRISLTAQTVLSNYQGQDYVLYKITPDK